MEFCGSHRAAYEKLSGDVAFDLPQGWEWTRLGDLCTISTGKRDANYGEANGKYCFFTCAALPIKCNGYSFEGESILLAGNGDIGNISYFNGKFEAYQRTYVLQALVPGCLILRYLYWHLKANWVTYNNDITYGSAIPYIRLGNLVNYFVALPPLTEQQRIVARVEELLNVVDSLGSAADGLEATAKRFDKKILDLAIRGKLMPQNPNDEPASELLKRIAATSHKSPCKNHETPIEPPFKIPKSWEWVKLGCVLDQMTSKLPEGDWFDYIDIDAIDNHHNRVIAPKHLPVTKAPSRATRELRSGDVLFSVVRPYLRNIALVDNNLAHCIASTGFYVCRPSVALYHCYLFALMVSEYVVTGLNAFMKGDNSPSIRNNHIQDYLIPLPPIAEQKRIVAKIEELRKITQTLTM